LAAFTIQSAHQPRYYLRLNTATIGAETDFSLPLSAALSRIGAETAIVYRFSPETLEFNAVDARFTIPPLMLDTGFTFGPEASHWLETLNAPAVGQPAAQANFEKFPEAFPYRIRHLLVIPLRAGDELLGLFSLGRSTEAGFAKDAAVVAHTPGRLLGAILERDLLRRKLAERKLVERAKGILQRRRRLSEEHAYLQLRNMSRRRRLPMLDVAREIIEETVNARAELIQERA
jgi:GAF domain-containing protein